MKTSDAQSIQGIVILFVALLLTSTSAVHMQIGTMKFDALQNMQIPSAFLTQARFLVPVLVVSSAHSLVPIPMIARFSIVLHSTAAPDACCRRVPVGTRLMRAASGANDQPISLKKIHYEPFKGRVLFHTKYSEYFKENLHMFDALDFLAQLTPDAWASNTTTQEWYDLPSISRRRDYN